VIVVSDTSVVSALLQLDHLDLLPVLYERVLIPAKVYEELNRLPAFTAWQATCPTWLEVRPIGQQTTYGHLIHTLDEGEAEAIALGLECQADFLLIDQTEGRAAAQQLGIRVIGVLGIFLEAKTRQLIPNVRPLLDQLRLTTTFRIAPTLYERVLRLADEA
jgi:predicted nucleic acid-binding protein